MPSSREFLQIPFDPTASVPAVWSANQATQLGQLIKQAWPSTDLGFVIVAASAPNVVLYPELLKFVWLKVVSPTVIELYGWNGTAWQLASTNATIAVGSIPLSALATVLADANKILQYNSSGVLTAVLASSLISSNSLTPAMLQNATPGVKYMLISNASTGVWSRSIWTSELDEWITTGSEIPTNRLKDLSFEGVENQVLYHLSTNSLRWGYVKDLIVNGTLPTNKLIIGAANANKIVVVNGSGDDFTYASPSVVGAAAVIAYGGVAAPPDAVVATVAKTLSWTAAMEIDPSAIVSVTATQLTFATVGYYRLSLTVPFSTTAFLDSLGRIYLYNFTDSAEVADACQTFFKKDTQAATVILDFLLNVTNAAKVYEVRIKCAQSGFVSLTGTAPGTYNYDGMANRYQQMTIVKQS